MNEAQFKQKLQEKGYGEAQALEYEPNYGGDMHTHDFAAFVFVVSGEFTLATEDGSTTHGPGEVCELAAGTRHAEQAGAAGATLLVGKK